MEDLRFAACEAVLFSLMPERWRKIRIGGGYSLDPVVLQLD
jgi:hypothetical protein